MDADWWNSPIVRAAVRASGWRENGDTKALLQAILDETERAPVVNMTAKARGFLASVDPDNLQHGGVNVPSAMVKKAISILLDYGATPEALVAAGLPEAQVQVRARTYRQWRRTAVKMLLEGAPPEDVLAACEAEGDSGPVKWGHIVKVADDHGLEVPQTLPRRQRKDSKFGPFLETIFSLYFEQGLKPAAIAEHVPVTPNKISSVVSDLRYRGRYKKYSYYLEESA